MSQQGIPGTELHLAARDGDLAVIIRASKRDINKNDGSGLGPIHWAAWRSNSETVKLLLSKGADPDKPDKDGNTAVHLAAAHGNLSNLRCLLESGASIWSFNDSRENPSHLAIKYNRGECFRFLDTLSVRMELTNKYLVDKLKTRSLKNYEKRQSKRSEAQAKAQAHLRKTTASSFKHKPTKSGASTITFSDMLNEAPARVAGSMRSSTSAFRKISEALKGSPSEMKIKSRLADNFTLKKSDDTDTALEVEGLAASTGAENAITTFENLESELEKPSPSQGSPSSRRRRQAPAVPVLTGSRIDPKLLDGDKEYDEFLLPLLLRPNILSTFLAANALESVVQMLQEQQIDLYSLSLCSDEDLQAINVPLGPRKKISLALERRNITLLNPGPLSDSAV